MNKNVARIEEGRNAFKNVTGKPSEKRSLEKPWIRRKIILE